MPTDTNFLEAAQDQQGVYARKRRIFALIQQAVIGPEVLAELLPGGKPHLFEKALWDYKEELPILPPKPTPPQTDAFNAKMAEVVKDVVAFYNTFGGYLIAGIKDNPRTIVGFSAQFDCGDLLKRVTGATQHNIGCHYNIVEIEVDATRLSLGVLHVPRRPDEAVPAQFRKDSPINPSGKQAFKRGEIYLRDGDQCRPAVSPEDYTLLCAPARRQIAVNALIVPAVLNNNLGPRDPSFVKFVGRQSYLEDLWKWLCDRYSSAKLLAGLGGLGKTTIAREFAEDVSRASPMGLEAVVWLSAKQRFFTAILDRYQSASRVDFTDVESLLKALLRELGHPEDKIDADATREALIDTAVESLLLFPALVIVDDVDSLDPQCQNDVFQTLVQIMNRTMVGSRPSSRILFTARLNLGAAPGQLIQVAGLSYQEFAEFVALTAQSMAIPCNYSKKQMESFHRAAGGSPTFAASILRLLQIGESLAAALEHWRGTAGEDVRRFAFKKELDHLTDSQIRTLYALCILGHTSQIELEHILQCNYARLRDDLGELRRYHLLALSGEAPAGGARLEVPGTIQLMRDLIRERVIDPNRIEQDCVRSRRATPKAGHDIGTIINRTVALWKEGQLSEALEVAKWADTQNPKVPDIACLLGSAYMKVSPPEPAQADIAFRKAHKHGCERPELFGLWAQAKQQLGDWIGLIEVTRLTDKTFPSSENLFLRAQAYAKVAETAEQSGHLLKAAENFRDGGREIDVAFRTGSVNVRVPDLKELRSFLFFSYLRVAARLYPNPDDHIQVWLAFLEAFDCYVRRPLVVRTGVQRLVSWWGAVCRREKPDPRAAELMKVQLGRLDQIIHTVSHQQAPDENLLAEIERERAMLQTSWNDYRRTLPEP